MIKALLLTIIIEELTGLIFYSVYKTEYKIFFLSILAVNLLTNPLLNSLVYILGIYNLRIILLLEIIVVITEGLLYKYLLDYNLVKGILMSLVLNICSYFIGGLLI